MVPTLHTPRLALRPLCMEDAPQIQVLFPHWPIVRFLAAVVPWPYPPDGAEAYLRDHALPATARGEEIHWSLRLRDAPEMLIGCLGLFPAKQDEQRGFWLGLPWQGKGLMTEAVIAANDFWFDVLQKPVLRAPKAVANTGSQRISEKTGMRVVATVQKSYVSGTQPSALWEITAAEWRARRGALLPPR